MLHVTDYKDETITNNVKEDKSRENLDNKYRRDDKKDNYTSLNDTSNKDTGESICEEKLKFQKSET